MKLYTFAAACLFAATACTNNAKQEMTTQKNETNYSELVATVMPVNDSDVTGSVTFTGSKDGVHIQGNFNGLSEGKHGFHIHQYGDCRADDGTSAGGHFNPADKDHGAPTDMDRHMGDLGNIVADANGDASLDYTDSTVKLSQIIGRGIIIHSGEDDLTSQPTGAAGSRRACGVIGVAQQ